MLSTGWILNDERFVHSGIEIALDPGDAEFTRFRAWMRNEDEACRNENADMGFRGGWGAVTEQLAALAEGWADRCARRGRSAAVRSPTGRALLERPGD